VILHSARVENYKGIRGPLDVTFDPVSPNLLEGPNGAGKSTLVEAILDGLIENHNTAGSGAEQMRPRETALTPSTVVVFEQGGTVYRISKTFLDSPKALLERRRQDGTYAAVAKGKTADEQVREMVRSQGTRAKDRPGERLGVLSVLCSPQGSHELPALSGNALTDIREMLGASVSGKRGAAFEKAVDKKYSSLWTPGGKPKKGKLTEIRERLAAAREELDGSRERMRQVATHEAAALELRSQSQETLERLAAARQESASLTQVAEKVLDLRAQRSLAVSRKEAANARYNQLWAEIDRIGSARKKARASEEAAPRLEEADVRAHQALEVRVQEGAAAHAVWEDASQPDPEDPVLDARIERAAEFLAIARELPALKDRFLRATGAAERRNALDNQLAALNAPDAAAWSAIQSAGRELDQATNRVEALELRLEIAAESDLVAEVAMGEPPGETRLAAGQALTARGDGQIKIRLPGIATLAVSGPSENAEQWRALQMEKRALLARLLTPFGVSAWQELLGRVEQRNALSAELLAAAAEYRAAIGSDSLERLESQTQELAARSGEILAVESSWALELPDLAALKEQAGAHKAARQQGQARAAEEWQAAQVRRGEAERAAASAAAERDGNRQTLAAAQAEIAALESDGRTMGERQEELNDRRRESDSAEANLQRIERELAALPAGAPDQLDAVRDRIASLESESQLAREGYQQDEAAARALLQQGPYTSLATAEEQVAQLETDEAAEMLRLDAIRLLKTAVDKAKAKVLERISEPVEERATAILARIADRPFARIQLGDGMDLESVRPEGCSGTAPVDQMSTGEQEQIYFATRLALAEVLSEEESQVVVLDDPLVNTDPQRLPRVLELIREKSARLQFVILSCHPERYANLPGVRSQRLDKLELQASEAGT
jgi:DNA repair exonuclease SbcCD ATPase subunit